VIVNREQVALKVVKTQRELADSEGVSRLKVRIIRLEEVNLQVQVGERSLPRLSGRCHGLRKPGRKLRRGRLLGPRCIPRRVHVIQQDLLQ
jgi:hypothetical protein